jgi:hypothetical protein
MIKPFKALAFFTFIFLVACNNNADVNSTVDSSQAPPVVLDSEQIAMQKVTEAFPTLYNYLKQNDSSFDAGKFIATQVDSLQQQKPLPLDEAEAKIFQPYFLYNNDSSYAIDLYSYNLVPRPRNGTIIFKEGGPDTEVGLINVQDKTRSRVYFGGSSSTVLDASWVDKNTFLLMAGEIVGEERFVPMIMKFDVPAQTIQRFLYEDTLQVRPSGYKDGRIKID